MNTNLIRSLLELRSQASPGIAYQCGDDSVTFKDLEARCLSMAGLFLQQGIQPREVVILYSEENTQWPVAWFALMLVGAVPMAVPRTKPQQFLHELVAQSGAAWVVCDQSVTDLPCPQLTLPSHITVDRPIQAVYQYLAGDEAFYLLSSGTSDRSKIVVHVMDGIGDAFAGTANPYGLTEHSVMHITVGLCSSWSMIMALLGCLATGYTVALAPGTTHFSHIQEWLSMHKVTHLMTGTRMLEFLSEHCTHLPRTLENIYISGDPASTEIIQRFRNRFGIDVFDSYGCSEVRCWAVLLNRVDRAWDGSVGQPGPGVVLELINDQGEVCTNNQVGRLIIKHPCIFAGYKTDAASIRPYRRDSVYVTPDYMTRDAQGFYYFVGRESDLVHSDRGAQSLIHLENRICDITGTADVVTLQQGGRLVLFIKHDALANRSSQELAGMVDEIYPVSHIPVTDSTGKKIRNYQILTKYVVQL